MKRKVINKTLKNIVNANADAGGNFNAYRRMRVEGTSLFDELATLGIFNRYRLKSIDVKLVPYDPNQVGVGEFLPSLSDEDTTSETTASVAANDLLNQGGRMVPAHKGASFHIPVNGRWKQLDDDPATPPDEDAVPETLQMQYRSSKTYSSLERIWEIEVSFNIALEMREF